MKIIKYALAGFVFVMGAYFLFNTFIKEIKLWGPGAPEVQNHRWSQWNP